MADRSRTGSQAGTPNKTSQGPSPKPIIADPRLILRMQDQMRSEVKELHGLLRRTKVWWATTFASSIACMGSVLAYGHTDNGYHKLAQAGIAISMTVAVASILKTGSNIEKAKTPIKELPHTAKVLDTLVRQLRKGGARNN